MGGMLTLLCHLTRAEGAPRHHCTNTYTQPRASKGPHRHSNCCSYPSTSHLHFTFPLSWKLDDDFFFPQTLGATSWDLIWFPVSLSICFPN
ncbi:hypothetical protein B0H65DRAFT_478307 [Neurospora tetraspora]|uniref:Secreted protein n=1 Tax=Neurospora tetraspora TaxID=94610 RepID=A0AAE0MMQ2_9PEZI|nr:hypothetical protein B0H65DRAFT_478307 [Neurospora tetraspora]